MKYSGVATNAQDVTDLKTINQYLYTFEAQLAQEFINNGGIDYLDRMNTDALFRELHLSQAAAFNESSGALRGLLGRLDFLVVIDSAEPTTARVRLIDVESGAVRAIEICKHKSSFLSITQESAPDCLRPFMARAKEATRIKLLAKSERLRQQSAQDRAAQEKAAKDQREARARAEAQTRDRENAQQLAQDRANAQSAEREKARQFALARAEVRAREQAEVDNQISVLRPDLDDARARLYSANAFWNELSKQLAASGQSLRSNIRTALTSANSDGRRCQELLSQRNVNAVKPCISKLNSDLDTLDDLK
jgi:hypothetical protein